jgi:hypothetical protein
MSGGSFSRKRYRELIAEMLCELRAKEKTLAAEPKNAVKQAVKAAAAAVKVADVPDLNYLADLLRAANSARGTAQIIAEAHAAAVAAQWMLEELDDEESLMVLL